MIPLKLKVTSGAEPVNRMSEVEMNKMAIKLYEQKIGTSYDDCIRAVEKFNGNQEAIVKHLTKQ